ncbi:MAG: THUMP domain-containing protein [Deferrisomatales bacterium]
MSRTAPERAPPSLEAFAVSPPGFEDLVAAELGRLGIRGGRAGQGGVTFPAGWGDVYRANLCSRVASRVLVRVAAFEAGGFRQLRRGLARVEWEAWLPPRAGVELRVATHRTPMYHSGKVAEVFREVIGREAPAPGDPPARLFLRIVGRRVVASLDTSGEHLHRRGYRPETGPAPLRENLAAALLRRAGWTGGAPLLDPLCGSGTFPVEAALLARRIPPGYRRSFAFEALPSFDRRLWEAVRREAEEEILPEAPCPVLGSDRDPSAVALTARAAGRAGVGGTVQVAVAELGELDPPARHGLLVANPPYGRRLAGGGAACRALSDALRGPFRDWTWGVIRAAGPPRGAFGLRPREVFPFRSGGLQLAFAVGGPEGRALSPPAQGPPPGRPEKQ